MKIRRRWASTLTFLLVAALLVPATGQAVNPGGKVFTTDADFELGTMVGVNHDVSGQLQLNATPSTFPFIWVANSDAGTVSKLDTVTGAELGRYWSAPNGVGRNPSRTTVDLDGNVWVGNRNSNTITKIGLKEANNCIDRNGNGVIDTSTGAGDVRLWLTGPNPDDECILLHVTLGTIAWNNNNVRAVAIDADNNVFAGMSAGPNIYHVNGQTGAIIDTFTSPFPGNYPNYGAVVDPEGNLWVAADGNNAVVKHTFDASGNHLASQTIGLPGWGYGMGIDSLGYIWVSGWTYNNVNKVRRSDGAVVATYYLSGYGGNGLRGVAVTADNDIWIAASYTNMVIRMRQDGTVAASIPVGNHPTGVAVDAAGKVWVTNYGSHNVTRVDPVTNTADGTFPVGLGPYNYSDMTGSIVRNITSAQGTWTVTHDGGTAGMAWDTVSWNGITPGDSTITSRVRAADTPVGLGASAWTLAGNGAPLAGVQGRYIEVEMKLMPSSDGTSPQLHDVAVDPWSGVCPDAPTLSFNAPLGAPGATIGPADTLDIGFQWRACGQHVRDSSATVRVRRVSNNTLVAGYTVGYGVTIDDAAGEYHQAFSPAAYSLPVGTQLKVMVYFGGTLRGTAYVTVQ